MNVKIRMSRVDNVARYGAEPVTLDIEEYLLGVVPAEMYESAAMDALKAQAVAARTYVLKRALEGTVITDTSNHQAYKVSLSQSCPRSRQAVMATKGEVLFHSNKLINCFYSASNGGITKRSGDVWSQHYPYYVTKVDDWDVEANREKPTKASHGIGMSQIGAMWVAKNGVSYKQILSFYYEGTALVSNYGQGGFSLPPDAEEEHEETVIAPDNEQGSFSSPTDTVEEITAAPLVIHERIMTKNDSYAYGRKIVPKGIMVHSTAVRPDRALIKAK
jgi:peptidoglycan hydrolase-like amidase